MVYVIRDITFCVPYYRFLQDGLAEYLRLVLNRMLILRLFFSAHPPENAHPVKYLKLSGLSAPTINDL